MTIWSYIGVISAMLCIFCAIALPAKRFQGKKMQNCLAVVAILAFILFATAVIWPTSADNMLYSESKSIFSLTRSDRMVNVVLMQEVDSGKYYIVAHNDTNLLVPTYREYLSDDAAKAYIAQYQALTASQDELVNIMDKIVGE